MELEKIVDPIQLFKKWLSEAEEKEIRDPNAMQLATVSKDGMPSVRTVLLKDIIDGDYSVKLSFLDTHLIRDPYAGKSMAELYGENTEIFCEKVKQFGIKKFGKPDLTKTDETRTIEITKQDIEMLKSYRVRVKEKLLPLRADINKVPVFFASDLGFLHSTQAWKQTKTVIRQAKLMPEGVKETRTFHDLRHTHASNLIDKEVYPPKIQKRLGHASLKITMDVYAHFFDKHDKKMVDTLVAIQGAQKGHFF